MATHMLARNAELRKKRTEIRTSGKDENVVDAFKHTPAAGLSKALAAISTQRGARSRSQDRLDQLQDVLTGLFESVNEGVISTDEAEAVVQYVIALYTGQFIDEMLTLTLEPTTHTYHVKALKRSYVEG